MSLIDKISKEQMSLREVPEFAAGDRLCIMVRVKEGNREREQAYNGVCIARHNNGVSSSFVVRKISYGEGVERVFPLYSPKIRIIVERRGRVRRAKLYYLRQRFGKSARIAERFTGSSKQKPAPAAVTAPQEKPSSGPAA